MFAPVARWLKVPFELWRHPIAAARRLAARRTWPSPADFDRMSRADTEAYLRRIGLDAKIAAARAAHRDDD